jgi:hypothetical protein
MEITGRKFSVKIERNNKDGTKTEIAMQTLSAKDQLLFELKLLEVFDTMVSTDDCREAKGVVNYISQLK